MLRILTIVICLNALQTTLSAQAQRIYEQYINVDEIDNLFISMPSEQVEVGTWEGAQIKIQAFVTTKNGSTHILGHLQRSERYDLILETVERVSTLKLKHAIRQTIKTQGQVMDEQIKYTIAMPAGFGAFGQGYAKLKK